MHRDEHMLQSSPENGWITIGVTIFLHPYLLVHCLSVSLCLLFLFVSLLIGVYTCIYVLSSSHLSLSYCRLYFLVRYWVLFHSIQYFFVSLILCLSDIVSLCVQMS